MERKGDYELEKDNTLYLIEKCETIYKNHINKYRESKIAKRFDKIEGAGKNSDKKDK